MKLDIILFVFKDIVKYGSEEKGSSLCRCSILLGFIVSKNLRGLWFCLLIKVQNATSLVFLTWKNPGGWSIYRVKNPSPQIRILVKIRKFCLSCNSKFCSFWAIKAFWNKNKFSFITKSNLAYIISHTWKSLFIKNRPGFVSSASISKNIKIFIESVHCN